MYVIRLDVVVNAPDAKIATDFGRQLEQDLALRQWGGEVVEVVVTSVEEVAPHKQEE